jgi:hypothetical protein
MKGEPLLVPPRGLKKQKNGPAATILRDGVSRNLTFRDYLTPLRGSRPLGRQSLSHRSETRMYNVKVNPFALPIPEGGVAYTTYFTDQEPIDGKLTVVDLTEGSCRWPTGNPRDLNTFRYCGAGAHSGPYCDRHARLAYMPRLPRAA